MRISDWSSDVCSSDLSAKSNPNALASIQRDTIFTNVAVTDDNQPWWEGLDDRVPAKDWQGRDYVAGNGKAAHPNSRFTVSAKQCPSYSPQAEAAQGVPISAIVFGGRRASLVPLVFERSEEHTSELQSLMRISYAV